MQAGKLDRRIVIERATATTNAFGEAVQAWAPLVTVWASKEDVSDGERWRASEVQATVSKRFRVRWSGVIATVTPRDRIIFEGRTYDIHHGKEIGRRVGWEFTCSARAG